MTDNVEEALVEEGIAEVSIAEEDSDGLGCGEAGCTCTYCNGDNFDRYMLDHVCQMLNEINRVLPEPISPDHDLIKGDEELFYKVIKRSVVDALSNT